jgi:hypothetical protein
MEIYIRKKKRDFSHGQRNNIEHDCPKLNQGSTSNKNETIKSIPEILGM